MFSVNLFHMKSVGFFIFLFFIFCLICQAKGGPGDDFNRRYLDVVVSLVASDSKEARRVADSLAKVANTDEQKIKAFMLLAKLDENKGDMKGCIVNAMRADTISNATLNFSWQASTSGFLATSFRQLGLLKVSERYLSKAEIANENQVDVHMKTLTKINILHERAFHCFEQHRYSDAKKYLKSAAELIHMDGQEDKKALLIKATNDQLMGICELKLGNMVAAESYLNASLEKIGSVESNLRPYIMRAKADVEIERNNLSAALQYLQMVEPYLTSGEVEELKMLTYESWASYYQKIGDKSKSLEFRSKAIDIKGKRDQVARDISDDLIEIFNIRKQYYKNRYTLAIGLILIITIIAAVCMIYYAKLKILYRTKYQVIHDIQDDGDVNTISTTRINSDFSTVINKLENNAAIKAKEINIAKDTEERLYQAFVEQEEAHFFLEKSVTLQHLATLMGTNMRYASYILQKFRGKDFYDYLQSSRVEYIIGKLKTSPELFDYKISFLAEMSGFTSLSRFSSAFKEVTGIPPSAFIHFMKKEIDQKK